MNESRIELKVYSRREGKSWVNKVRHAMAIINRLKNGSLCQGDNIPLDDHALLISFGYPSTIVINTEQLIKHIADRLEAYRD